MIHENMPYYRQQYEIQRVSASDILFRKKLSGNTAATDVTSHEWLFMHIRIHDGKVRLKLDADWVIAEKGVYGLFAPPFSIYHSQISSDRTDMTAYFSLFPMPRGLPDGPVFFRWQSPVFEGNFPEMAAALNAADDFLSAGTDEPDERPYGSAHRIKLHIDRTFEQDCVLTKLADELAINPAHLSRVFKKRYGLTPVDYRGKLRSVWAVQKLIRSNRRNISEVAFEVGYNDLSRFNKQFKRHLKMAPGAIKKFGDN